ncbi:hypothetical protein HY991_03795 [Candidatus Micrarchaeota archaeon]|nr:hypothetical protein [Candidatus Micrarchaeota archaeon]
MKKTLVLFAIALCFLSLAKAISSAAALEATRPYLEERGEEATLSQYNPVEMDFFKYWFVYFSPVGYPQTKNLVLVISDESGAIVTDEAKLTSLILLDYKLDDIIEQTIKRGKASFTDLKIVFDDVRTKISSAESGLSSIISQVESKNYQLGFASLEETLANLRDASDDLSYFIEDGIALEQDFMNDPSATGLDDLFLRYNETITRGIMFMGLVEKYHQLIDSKRTQVIGSKNISYEDKTKIVDSLAAIRSIGVDSSFKNKVLLPVANGVSTRLRRSDAEVNDTVKSILFRKTRKDALNIYDREKQAVQAIVENEVYYTACAIDLRELKQKWKDFYLLIGKGSHEAYVSAIENSTEIDRLLESINSRYKVCLEGKPMPPTPPFDFGPILLVLAALGIGYTAYWYFKKKREEAEEL